MLKCSEEEVAAEFVYLSNNFLVLGVVKFLSLTCVLDAGDILHIGSVPFFPLWWWAALSVALLPCNVSSHLWPLTCLCSAVLLPVKHQVVVSLNITAQSLHVFLNIVGQSQLSPNQDCIGQGSDGEEDGDWEQQLRLQTTTNTYWHGILIKHTTIMSSINSSLN